MSEHIFQTDEIDGVFSVFVAPNIVVSDMIGQREEVVRCRDCGRAYRRGGGVYCSRVLQWGSNDRPAPLPVDPDGFCAWGERREES